MTPKGQPPYREDSLGGILMQPIPNESTAGILWLSRSYEREESLNTDFVNSPPHDAVSAGGLEPIRSRWVLRYSFRLSVS